VEAVAAPVVANYRDIATLAHGRKPMLHAHLVHSVHPVKVVPGRVEIRTKPDAPRDLAQQITALLLEFTGTRWTVALSNAEGEPTLADQGRAADQDRRALARTHPLVQAVLEAFPGATIEAVRDASLDNYGLPPPSIEPDPGRDFAPPDAEPVGLDDDISPED
jgi:DNA polymerase-3 subunit gamma/tau